MDTDERVSRPVLRDVHALIVEAWWMSAASLATSRAAPASRQVLENPTTPARQDRERLLAVLSSLEEWKEAFREELPSASGRRRARATRRSAE